MDHTDIMIKIIICLFKKILCTLNALLENTVILIIISVLVQLYYIFIVITTTQVFSPSIFSTYGLSFLLLAFSLSERIRTHNATIRITFGKLEKSAMSLNIRFLTIARCLPLDICMRIESPWKMWTLFVQSTNVSFIKYFHRDACTRHESPYSLVIWRKKGISKVCALLLPRFQTSIRYS